MTKCVSSIQSSDEASSMLEDNWDYPNELNTGNVISDSEHHRQEDQTSDHRAGYASLF